MCSEFLLSLHLTHPLLLFCGAAAKLRTRSRSSSPRKALPSLGLEPWPSCSELHYFFAQLIRSSCLYCENHTRIGFLTNLLLYFSLKVLPFSLSFLLCSFWPASPANCLKPAALSAVVLQRRGCIHDLLVHVLKMKAGHRQKAASVLTSWVEQKWALSNPAGVYQLLSHPLSQHLATHPQKKTTALKSFGRSRITLDKPTVNWRRKMKNFQDIRSLTLATPAPLLSRSKCFIVIFVSHTISSVEIVYSPPLVFCSLCLTGVFRLFANPFITPLAV